MKKINIEPDLMVAIVSVVVGVVVLGICIMWGVCEHIYTYNKYNNGQCQCGGHWAYSQAVGHAYGTGFLYICDECGDTVELKTKE